MNVLRAFRQLLSAALACLVLLSTPAAANPASVYSLEQNQPNPFCPTEGTTSITFLVPGPQHVRLVVKDPTGTSVIRTLVDGDVDYGGATVVWDGRDQWGVLVPDGNYPYTMVAGGFTDTKTASVTCGPPLSLSLEQNTPNPFAPCIGQTTAIRFSLPGAGQVYLDVRRTYGALVKSLVNGVLPAGDHEVVWDGRDRYGAVVEPENYDYTLNFGLQSRYRTATVVCTSGGYLLQNSPNPFCPCDDFATSISFSTYGTGHVTLIVRKASGTLVRTLVDQELTAGAHSVVWDGRDDGGASMPSGSYPYTLTLGSFTYTRTATLSCSPALGQNSPNPFCPIVESTTIPINIHFPGPSSLKIYDAGQNLVRTLLESDSDCGSRSIVWDGRNDGGALVPSGRYRYVLTAGSSTYGRTAMVSCALLSADSEGPFCATADPMAIQLRVPAAGHVSIIVKDGDSGNVLRSLVDGEYAAGIHTVAWDGRDSDGRPVPDGSHIVRMTMDSLEASCPVEVGCSRPTHVVPSTWGSMKALFRDASGDSTEGR